MAQTAEEIAGPIGDIIWDSARSQAFIDGGLEAGMEYTVRSRIVVPTPEELDQVDHLAPRAYGRWTELPADLDPRIAEIAERWTADATSDYRKVLAIQQHFHSGGFVYSTDVEHRRRRRRPARVPHADQGRLLSAVHVRDGGHGAGAGAAGTHRGRVPVRDPAAGRQLPGPDQGRPRPGSRCCSLATGGSSSSRSRARPIQTRRPART